MQNIIKRSYKTECFHIEKQLTKFAKKNTKKLRFSKNKINKHKKKKRNNMFFQRKNIPNLQRSHPPDICWECAVKKQTKTQKNICNILI